MINIIRLLIVLCGVSVYCQPINLYRQFTGNYDFVKIGNTMNTAPNGTGAPCTILTQSSATLNLNVNQTILAAYLYWSGSGNLNQADLNVRLNTIPISAQRTFATNGPGGLQFFGAFADVTNFVKATGSGVYTISDFDLTNVIPSFCATGSNYAGWSIVVVFENLTLPNRVVSVFEGFQIVDHTGKTATVTLSGLDVTDVNNAKVGFLAWEGDENIAVTEELLLNGQIVSNPPLNPGNNAFNNTNSYTGATNLWNMDLDFYDIGNFINLGDSSINITIKTGQDLIIVNNIVVALSSLFADATIAINDVQVPCESRKIDVIYTVSNLNGTSVLPSNVPIAFYADDILLRKSATTASIPIGESVTDTISLTIPTSVGDSFTITASVDDDGNDNSSVVEIDENNNKVSKVVDLIFGPEVDKPKDMILCDTEEFGYVYFDLTEKLLEASTSSNVNLSFHKSKSDAEKGLRLIEDYTRYQVKTYTTENVWVRVQDKTTGCVSTTSFKVIAQMKPFTELIKPLMICNFKHNASAANLSIANVLLSKVFDYTDEVALKFYETLSDAENNINEITNISNYKPPQFPHIIFIKAIGKTDVWCDNIIQLQLNDCVVPKGISPNGDGLNDGFNLEIFNPIEVKIFNRYGMEVYVHGEGYTNQWVGQDKNNRELPSGTYYYHFKTLFDTYVGYVYLIKEVK